MTLILLSTRTLDRHIAGLLLDSGRFFFREMKASLIAFILCRPAYLEDHASVVTRTSMPSNVALENNILSLDAYTLCKKMESGEITSLQLMEATLNRIHEVNPTYRALIGLLPDDTLLKKARQMDNTPRQGWLHGIPFAIKDLSNAAGFPTTLGGSPLVDHDTVASESDDFCQRLLDAGAIVIGKTNTPEHGLGSHTYNTKWGTTINPYSPPRHQPISAGGSSGGAAVAIATRMLCVADGSDMMGSLRNPAGWNNIYSLRPTAGMMGSDDGLDCNPLPFPISTVGPMARTPRDVAFLLETMSNNTLGDPSVEEILVDGMRIGWLGDWGGAYAMEPGIQPLCRQALETLKEKGVTVDDINEPLFDATKLWDSWTTIRSKILSTSAIAEYGEEAFLGPNVKVRTEMLWEVKRGMKISDSEVAKAAATANEWSDCVKHVLSKYDALALPTAQVWPFDSRLDWPKSVGSKEMDTYHRWMEVVVPATLGGLPCMTIPAGFGENGLSMGIQLIGGRGSDAKLLSLAQAYHSVTDWPSKRPPVFKD